MCQPVRCFACGGVAGSLLGLLAVVRRLVGRLERYLLSASLSLNGLLRPAKIEGDDAGWGVLLYKLLK